MHNRVTSNTDQHQWGKPVLPHARYQRQLLLEDRGLDGCGGRRTRIHMELHGGASARAGSREKATPRSLAITPGCAINLTQAHCKSFVEERCVGYVSLLSPHKSAAKWIQGSSMQTAWTALKYQLLHFTQFIACSYRSDTRDRAQQTGQTLIGYTVKWN